MNATVTKFNMTPVHPTQGKNPVTRILNMVRGSDGALHKRKKFDIGGIPVSGTVQNHIVAELDGVTRFISKIGATIKAGTTTLTPVSDDPPNVGAAANANEVGSFAVYNREVYYFDSNTCLVYDGTTVRRPGVLGLTGKEYNTTAGFGFGHALEGEWYYYPSDPGDPGAPGWPDTSGKNPYNPATADPYILVGPTEGDKTLNTGFCFSWYDPERRIYGRRSEVFALPYVYGPQGVDSVILSDAREQYSKYIKTPPLSGLPTQYHDYYKVAVWFTLGQNILTQATSATWEFGEGWWIQFWGQYGPAMGKRMAGTLFLEGHFPPGGSDIKCTKDNASLFESGRYIDTFSRPLPSKFMCILSNGTAIYFYPWKDEAQIPGSATLANAAEYSHRHPEQIGRNTTTQRDTVTALADLRGDPIAVVNDGRHRLMVTKQAVYQIGFDRGLVLRQISSSGLRCNSGRNGVVTSSAGVLWYADEGVVWLRGGQTIVLDEKIGFSDWFDALTHKGREKVVIGVCESLSQILVFLNDASNRIMVYDYAKNFACEFSEGSADVKYAAFFRGDNNAKLWAWPSTGGYPHDSTHTSEDSLVECWVNDDLDRVKTIRDVKIDLGPTTGNVTVEIDGYHSGSTTEDSKLTMNRDQTISNATGGGRFVLAGFTGMRGKLFRVTITGPSSSAKWSLSRIDVEYDYDEGGDARGA